jgi:uncharacterized protein YoxC
MPMISLLINPMKLEHKMNGYVTISVSVNELETINNALNEVCNALGVDEFQTRMGATLDEARELLREVNQIFDDCEGS